MTTSFVHIQTVSKRTKDPPGSAHSHAWGEKPGGGGRGSGKSPARVSCSPRPALPSPAQAPCLPWALLIHAVDARGSPLEPSPRPSSARGRRARVRRGAGDGGCRSLRAPAHAEAAPTTLESAAPTYVPRVSLNSKIFLMSSACFFQEELLSPFSRAMADEGSAAGRPGARWGGGAAPGCRVRRRSCPEPECRARGCPRCGDAHDAGRGDAQSRGAESRDAGLGEAGRGDAQDAGRGDAGRGEAGRRGPGARCRRASSSAVSSFTLAAAAAAAVPPWL